MMRSQVATSISWKYLPPTASASPALLTEAVDGAEGGGGLGHGGDGAGVGHVAGDEVGVEAVAAQAVGGLLAPGGVEFGEDDAVAVGADPAGRGQSQATAGAGDDDHRCGGGHQSRVTPCIGECSG